MPMRQALNKIHRMPAELHKEFDLLLAKRVIDRKDNFLMKDHYPDHVYFLHEGVLRIFKHEAGHQVTIWLITPGQVVHFPKRFFTDAGKFIFDIQVLYECVVSSISKEQLHYLKLRYPELNALCDKISERFEVNYENYLRTLIQDVDTRYEYIVEHLSYLGESQYIEMLSSFMNMSKRTYYRCLKKRMKNGF